MIASSSTFYPYPGRVIRDLFRQLHAIWHGAEALVYSNHPREAAASSYFEHFGRTSKAVIYAGWLSFRVRKAIAHILKWMRNLAGSQCNRFRIGTERLNREALFSKYDHSGVHLNNTGWVEVISTIMTHLINHQDKETEEKIAKRKASSSPTAIEHHAKINWPRTTRTSVLVLVRVLFVVRLLLKLMLTLFV